MTDASPENELRITENHSWLPPIYVHRLVVFLTYISSIVIAISAFSLSEAQLKIVTLLSSGAILATFGSAISTLGIIWERDLLERARLNIDILYQNIIRQEQPWRRWPFLPRRGKRRMLDGTIHLGTFSNPGLFLNVGTHIIRVSIPTVLEDFFDLSVMANFVKLVRFRSAAATTFSNRQDNGVNPETGMNREDEYMAYECLYDTWRSIFVFRLARYAIHFGASLTIAAVCLTAVNIVLGAGS